MSDVNKELLRQTMDHILAHPERHDQEVWAKQTECGTAYCFAGWACVLSGLEADWGQATPIPLSLLGETHTGELTDGQSIDYAARELLGLTDKDSLHLFRPENTVADLKHYVDELCEHGRITSTEPDPW